MKKEDLITSPKLIAKTLDMGYPNLMKTYIGNPKREKQLRAFDLGTWIMSNDIAHEEIILAINVIKATKEQIRNKI